MKSGIKLFYPHLALLGANIIYGLNYSIAKILMPDYIRPLGLVALRAIVATTLFWLFSIFFPREKVERKDLLYMMTFFIFGVFFNQVFFLIGLDRTTPINASLLMLLNPVLAIVFGALILRERLSGRRITGVIIGMAGTALLILGRDDFVVGGGSVIGDVLILLTAASWALFLVMMKRMTDKYNNYTVMKWIFLFGLFPNVTIGFSQLSQVSFVALPTIIILAFIYVTVFTTFVGYNMNIYGLKYVSPTVVSTYVYLQPVIAVAVSIALGQDSLNALKVLSAILVFAGVYLVSVNRSGGIKVVVPD
ncbi:MAG: DMT family transporter [Bacteroidales bacterium]